MKLKLNITRPIQIAAIIVVVAGLIAFTERMKGDVVVADIRIQIDNVHENHFLDENDIIDLMEWNHENIRGVSVSTIDFRAIENRIKRDPFISDAEMYSDLTGNLVVNVALRRPIARIVRNDGPDGYVAEDGTLMPVSEKFTARVLLISGPYVRKMLQARNVYELDNGKELMQMITAIRYDEFWNAQIAQLDIDGRGRITMHPQVGDERIEFGVPENIDGKFRKLRIFYGEILPRSGWNRYDRVNLEYEGQVVAE